MKIDDKTFAPGTSTVLHARSTNPNFAFAGWTLNESPLPPLVGSANSGQDYPIIVNGDGDYRAIFKFMPNLTLDPMDDDNKVPKDKTLTMTFNGIVLLERYVGKTADEDDSPSRLNTGVFQIIDATTNTLHESFSAPQKVIKDKIPTVGANAFESPEGVTLVGVNPLSKGSIKNNVVSLDPAVDFIPGHSYYVLTGPLCIAMPKGEKEKDPGAQSDVEASYNRFSASFMGFSKAEDWNFSIPNPTNPGGPAAPGTVTPGVERDRADGPVATTAIAAEPTPLAAPAVKAQAAPAPAQIVEEAIPLGVPVLPKTGEIPASLFYGIGGILAAAGAFMKRK